MENDHLFPERKFGKEEINNRGKGEICCFRYLLKCIIIHKCNSSFKLLRGYRTEMINQCSCCDGNKVDLLFCFHNESVSAMIAMNV